MSSGRFNAYLKATNFRQTNYHSRTQCTDVQDGSKKPVALDKVVTGRLRLLDVRVHGTHRCRRAGDEFGRIAAGQVHGLGPATQQQSIQATAVC